MGWTRTAWTRVTAVGGMVLVIGYAALLAVHALVLDPLAAVPGRSLRSIYAGVDAIGLSTTQDVVGVLVSAGTGVAMAVGVAVVGLRQRMPLPVVAVCHLALLAFGAAAVFQSGFFLGMDVADAFGVSGAVHAWSGQVLFTVSLVALAGIPVVLVATAVRTARRSRTAG
ncbi:hypothetical protein LQK89_15320 [Curtobacterium sp. C1]|uniref:Uncharacterized protein n=1 Tax=Curtobacterium citreum TaxID=2036 RepID=A0ABT2HGQ5_9MICO|nr:MULTISPECIES: hypothetical protein [Curtobacterium]MCS6522338.1 hypothetical protein [Curtobacterium citreum]QKS15168.1 hypothetical protein HUN59_02200 [Curtobacterium sp. Csp2]RDI01237.1 hypothetical protein DEU32_102265 [Curtobacterium sp. AG1037]TQJ29466.1 hypothetical protein FB462_3388 [Curtobacterium citreum]UFU13854.1 hypothetical protein LQK89_15320 [Curtobacterium sp. C1]